MFRQGVCVLMLLAAAGLSLGGEPAQPDLVFSGRVVDQSAAGVGGIDVQAVSGPTMYRARTDGQGRFTLRVSPQSTGSVVVLADDPRQDRMGVFQGISDAMTIRLRPARHVTVEIVDADGKPAAGATVGAVSRFDALPTVRANRAGRVDLRLPTDFPTRAVYALRSDAEFDCHVRDGQETESVSEWIEKGPLRLHLTRSRTIRFRLVDTDERPIAGAELFVRHLSKPGTKRNFLVECLPKPFRARTDDRGSTVLVVPDWPDGLTIHVEHEAYISDWFRINPSADPDAEATIRLHRPIMATGVVQFSDGRPVEGVWVSVVGAADGHRGFDGAARTDATGRFKIRLQPELQYVFAVSDAEWAAPIIDGVVAVPKKPIDHLRFRVGPPARVEGHMASAARSR